MHEDNLFASRGTVVYLHFIRNVSVSEFGHWLHNTLFCAKSLTLIPQGTRY